MEKRCKVCNWGICLVNREIKIIICHFRSIIFYLYKVIAINVYPISSGQWVLCNHCGYKGRGVDATLRQLSWNCCWWNYRREMKAIFIICAVFALLVAVMTVSADDA